MFCVTELKMQGLPTLILYKEGKETKRLAGQQITAEDIEKAVGEVL